MKKRKYLDIAFILLLGYYIAMAVNSHFVEGSVLSLNFFIGVLGWIFTVYSTIKNEGKYNLLVLLLLSVFNVVVFSASITSFGQVYLLYKSDNINIASVGIDPFKGLIFIVYAILNWNVVCDFYAIVVGDSKENQLEKHTSMVDFYYKKFNNCSDDELKVIFNNYKDYPIEAQQAILQLKEHKGFGLR